MSKPEHEAEAARIYREAACEIAEHQVVAAAEDVLTDAWIGELEQYRAGLLRVAEHTRQAGQADRAGGELVFRRLALQEVTRLLREADAALEAVCATGIERARQLQHDLVSLLSLSAGAGRADICESDTG